MYQSLFFLREYFLIPFIVSDLQVENHCSRNDRNIHIWTNRWEKVVKVKWRSRNRREKKWRFQIFGEECSCRDFFPDLNSNYGNCARAHRETRKLSRFYESFRTLWAKPFFYMTLTQSHKNHCSLGSSLWICIVSQTPVSLPLDCSSLYSLSSLVNLWVYSSL